MCDDQGELSGEHGQINTNIGTSWCAHITEALSPFPHSHRPDMGDLSNLPLELITLIVDNLHDDRATLRACAPASHVFLPRSQAHLFERIELRPRRSRTLNHQGAEVVNQENTDTMQTCIPSAPHGVLSYTRNLSIVLGLFAKPYPLDGIRDHLMAFKNVSDLRILLYATQFFQEDLALASRYFSNFRQTLRCLHLKTWLTNPKDLITFIAFFPLLEEVSIDGHAISDPLPFPYHMLEGPGPDPCSLFKGSLRLNRFQSKNNFATELVKFQVRYHTLSISNVEVSTGIQELIMACAPTLRVLNIVGETCEPSPILSATELRGG